MPRTEYLKPARHPSSAGISASILATPVARPVSIWVGDAGVLFIRSGPVVLFCRGQIILRNNLPSRTIRRVALWLAENNLPTLSGVTPDPDFHEKVLLTLATEISSILTTSSRGPRAV